MAPRVAFDDGHCRRSVYSGHGHGPHRLIQFRLITQTRTSRAPGQAFRYELYFEADIWGLRRNGDCHARRGDSPAPAIE